MAPPVAAALGRCLLMAASEDAPVATPVVEVGVIGIRVHEHAPKPLKPKGQVAYLQQGIC